MSSQKVKIDATAVVDLSEDCSPVAGNIDTPEALEISLKSVILELRMKFVVEEEF